VASSVMVHSAVTLIVSRRSSSATGLMILA
jgi:hypothetical protein